MGTLSNARHERFAQELAKGKTQSEAYLAAGYCCNQVAAGTNANRLLRNDMVQARIAELKQNGAKRAEITLESLLEEAAEIQAAAFADKQYNAATAAFTAKAKLSGYWIERGENTNQNVNYVMSDQPMTAEEWAADRVTEH